MIDNDRSEFEFDRKSRVRRLIKICLGIALVLIGAGLIYMINNPPEFFSTKIVKKEKEKAKLNEYVPEFKLPEPKPAPEPEPVIKIVELPKPIEVKEDHFIEPPKKPDENLMRRLNSPLNTLKEETRQVNNLKAIEPVSEATVEPNIDLSVTETGIIQASMLPSLRWIIPKGTPISCAMETAIQSDQPGQIKCQLTEDVYSADDSIKLLARGSVATGEYRPQTISYGKCRLFAIWSRIRTPEGIVINIHAPATDNLGRAGIGGFIDNHYFERFGTAILVSIIDDGFENSNTEYWTNTNDSLNEVAAQMLKEFAHIRPTLHTWQGARVNIFTMNDLDLSSVYNLKLNRDLLELVRTCDVK